MSRFEVTREDDRLTLRMSLSDRLLLVGCALFVVALACAGTMGLLGFVVEASSGTDHSALQPAQLFSPHGNHFGFLWLVAMLALLALVPVSAAKAHRAALLFVFDRRSGRVLRNGRPVALIRRIEGIRVRRSADPDDVPLHKLVLVHGDGMELVLHTSYDEREILDLARDVAGFLGLSRCPDSPLSPGGNRESMT